MIVGYFDSVACFLTEYILQKCTYELNCKTKYEQKCKNVPKKYCHYKQECRNVPTKKCNTKYMKKCEAVSGSLE